MDVAKKKTITFNMLDQNQPTVAKDVASEDLDTWDHDSAGYHARTASLMGSNGSPYSYGVNDMAYYGAFSNVGGCGSMWRPYFASAAWDPYSNGAFAYYPNAGYSWVSPYPWGWTPYHYGSWSYCNGSGWGWMPGGSWNGLNNTAYLTSGGGGLRRFPGAPVHPPAAGEPTLMAVNLKPLVRSQITSAESFQFRKDSAGLGVPRGELGNLNKFSQHAIEHGAASTHVYLSVAPSVMNNGRLSGAGLATASVHRGYAASSEIGSSSRSEQGSSRGGGGSMSAASAPSVHASAPASGGGGSHH
jgi:hypothetical protein